MTSFARLPCKKGQNQPVIKTNAVKRLGLSAVSHDRGDKHGDARGRFTRRDSPCFTTTRLMADVGNSLHLSLPSAVGWMLKI